MALGTGSPQQCADTGPPSMDTHSPVPSRARPVGVHVGGAPVPVAFVWLLVLAPWSRGPHPPTQPTSKLWPSWPSWGT